MCLLQFSSSYICPYYNFKVCVNCLDISSGRQVVTGHLHHCGMRFSMVVRLAIFAGMTVLVFEIAASTLIVMSANVLAAPICLAAK